jgi:hypothetical protein
MYDNSNSIVTIFTQKRSTGATKHLKQASNAFKNCLHCEAYLSLLLMERKVSALTLLSDFNPLKLKLVQVMFKHLVPTSKKTLHVPIKRINWL